MNTNAIVLVAVTNVNNYGTMLQNYALQEALYSILNVSTPIIDCRYRNKLKQVLRILNRALVVQILNQKQLIYKLKINETYWNYWNSRKQVFEQFRKESIIFTEPIFTALQLVKKVEGKSQVILGSDQVWNPVNLGRDYYTLSFVPERVQKITYAPSFGITSIPWYQRKKTKSFLQRIDFLSVREETGKKIIQDLTGRDAIVVCDPTILLTSEKWEEFEQPVYGIPQKYILCYFLGNNNAARTVALSLKEETGYPIIHFPFLEEYVKQDENFGDIVLDGIGPREFVYLVHHANIVCTDSFHGTVFSTLFHKEFYCFSRSNKIEKMSTGSRIQDFLNVTGMENRIGLQKKLVVTEEAYKQVDCKLEQFRKLSIDYLKRSLEDSAQ